MGKYKTINQGFWSTHCYQSIPIIPDKSKEIIFEVNYEKKTKNANKFIHSCVQSLDHGPLFSLGSLGSSPHGRVQHPGCSLRRTLGILKYGKDREKPGLRRGLAVTQAQQQLYLAPQEALELECSSEIPQVGPRWPGLVYSPTDQLLDVSHCGGT